MNVETWDGVADTLSVLFGATVIGRGCREHLDLLVKKFKADEQKALKRSGTEEEYSELSQLLEDVSAYISDCDHNKLPGNSNKKKKEAEDKQKERKLSMTDDTDSSDDDLAFLQDDKQAGKNKRKENKRVGSSHLLSYLTSKYEDTLKIKQRKLDIEERKLELEEKRMNLEKEKWDFLYDKQQPIEQ